MASTGTARTIPATRSGARSRRSTTRSERSPGGCSPSTAWIPTPARPQVASPAPGRTAAISLRSSRPSRSATGSAALLIGSGYQHECRSWARYRHFTVLQTDESERKHADRRARYMCGMRRALGPTLVLAAAVVLAGFELGLGCSHDPKPTVVEPAGPPPLPPASGTPIGYLVDDAGELKLSDEQLTKLKAIDDDLAAKLAVLDAQLHTPSAGAGSG